MLPFSILASKRRGEPLDAAAIAQVVAGATDGSWSDARLAAFLMAVAIHGLDGEETGALTRAMLDSGDRWRLADEMPVLADKHSTGGVGDKVSLVLAPLLAACGVPVVMLTGRALGHTGGTADKLEAIPGLGLELDRSGALRLLRETGVAIGVATGSIAPADRRLYALRDETATIESLPLITASILSKKLATGAGALVLDVKVGSGAFLPEVDAAAALARLMVETACALGCPTSAWLTDMSQPLGRWVGHAAEVVETLETLAGDGPPDLVEISVALAAEVAGLLGVDVTRERLLAALASGEAREVFLRWAAAQGAAADWCAAPRLDLAPEEVVLRSPAGGWLEAVDTRALGLLLVEGGGGRVRAGAAIDMGVSLRCRARIGDRLEPGDEVARLFLRRPDDGLARRTLDCFRIGDRPAPAPRLMVDRIPATTPAAS